MPSIKKQVYSRYLGMPVWRIEDAIREAERLGFSISLEEFNGDEEAFWEVWSEREARLLTQLQDMYERRKKDFPAPSW